MIVVWILGGLLTGILLLLLLPVRYEIHLEPWLFSCRITALFGVFHKTISFSKEEEAVEEDTDTMAELLAKAEAFHQEESKEENAAKQATKESSGLGQKKLWDEDIEEEDDPSLMAQFRFALDNGLLEKLFRAAGQLISHGYPRNWRIYGTFGTGDPMETGVISGMTAAFLPQETQGILWNYLERVIALSADGKGRMIPIYVLYIAIRLAASKEARSFWHFRKGGTHHG